MKLAIASDFHLGFGQGTEREEECFEQALQCFQLAIEENVDLILLAGDLFDSDVPKQETWVKAFQLFSALKQKSSDLKIKKLKGSDYEKIFSFNHVPVVSIHGTHEFRGKDFKNALDVLESAGFLVHLHAAKAIVQKDSEEVVIHGLSGVPEKKALDVLKMWNPKPVEGKKNILVLHQSIKEFLPFEDEMIATISIADLPKDFDLIVNGHLHWNSLTEEKNIKLLVPGSTIITQMKKLEAEKEKGFYILETNNMTLSFKPLKSQRKLFYEKIELKEADVEKIKSLVEEKVKYFIEQSDSKIKPLIKLRLTGSLAKGLSSEDISLNEFKQSFSDKAILSIDADFVVSSFKEKIKELQELQKSKKSITSLGFEILEKNLSETGFDNAFDVKRVFDLLLANELDKVVEILSKKKFEKENLEKNLKKEPRITDFVS